MRPSPTSRNTTAPSSCTAEPLGLRTVHQAVTVGIDRGRGRSYRRLSSRKGAPVAEPESPPTRYEVTVHPPRGEVVAQAAVAAQVADLDLDRLPDSGGEVRLLVDLADVGRLAQQGFEVRVERALAVQPLDPSLVASDDDVQGWLDRRLAGD